MESRHTTILVKKGFRNYGSRPENVYISPEPINRYH